MLSEMRGGVQPRFNLCFGWLSLGLVYLDIRTYAYDELGCIIAIVWAAIRKPIVYFKVVAVGALCATGAAL